MCAPEIRVVVRIPQGVGLQAGLPETLTERHLNRKSCLETRLRFAVERCRELNRREGVHKNLIAVQRNSRIQSGRTRDRRTFLNAAAVPCGPSGIEGHTGPIYLDRVRCKSDERLRRRTLRQTQLPIDVTDGRSRGLVLRSQNSSKP